MPTTTRSAGLTFVGDLAFVVLFVLIGRATHDGDPLGGILTTLWPFAAGLVVGWLVVRAWRHPLSPLRSGLPVWIATALTGMLLRAMTGQGVQLAFVIVAAVVLGVFLVGWRLVAQRMMRGRSGSVPVQRGAAAESRGRRSS